MAVRETLVFFAMTLKRRFVGLQPHVGPSADATMRLRQEGDWNDQSHRHRHAGAATHDAR